MSSYHYGPTGERIEDDDPVRVPGPTRASDEAGAPSKWHPEPDYTDAWNDYNSGEDCPHGVIGGMDLFAVQPHPLRRLWRPTTQVQATPHRPAPHQPRQDQKRLDEGRGMSPAVAIYEGRRILATAAGPAVAACPGCASPMRAKRGTVVVHHWAHLPDPDRQCVSEGETEWHLGWKNRAGDPDRIEVAVGNRRADVLTPYGWAIEFQHSPLSPPDVAARERDWRDDLGL